MASPETKRTTNIKRIGDEGYVFTYGQSDGDNIRNQIGMVNLCGDLLWHKAYNSGEYGFPVGIVYHNSLIYIGCYKGDQTSLLILDLVGNVVNAFRFSSTNSFYPRNMIETADGNLVWCGATNPLIGSGEYEFYVMKTTFDGVPIWAKAIGNYSFEFGHNIMQDNDGSYIACGYTRNYVGDIYKGCVIKLDENGDVLWANEYALGTGRVGLNFCSQYGDYYYLSGYADQATTLGGRDGLLVKTDLNGQLIWAKFYGSAGNELANSTRVYNDKLYLSGSVRTNTHQGDFYLAELDADGNILDKVVFGTDGEEGAYGCGSSLEIDDDGFYGLTMNNNSSFASDYILVFKMSHFDSCCARRNVSIQVANAPITVNTYVHNSVDLPVNVIPAVYTSLDLTAVYSNICDISVPEEEDPNDPGTGIPPNENPGTGNPPNEEPGGVESPKPETSFELDPVNIFTPQEDGLNDLFTFEKYASVVSDFQCVVVNRWGVTVATLRSITDAWDGTDATGERCTDGVYFYAYNGTTVNGISFSGQGSLQLIGDE